MFRSARGQGWAADYALSILIFIIAATLAVKIVANVLQDDEFEEVRREAVSVSEHLMSSGNPELWVPSDVVRIGLTSSKNRLNPAKIDNFLELNYSFTRTRFGNRHHYSFYFEDKNGTVLGMGTECALGSPEVSENKTFYDYLRPAAYYFKDTSLMAGWMTSLQADTFDGNDDQDVNAFYENLSQYRFVLLEDPFLREGGSWSDQRKKDAVEMFVRQGGVLFMTGNQTFNLTSVGFLSAPKEDGVVIEDEDPYLELTVGRKIEDRGFSDDSIGVVDKGATNFVKLAEFNSTGDAFVARWDYGLGSAYYSSTPDADYTGGSLTLNFVDKIGEGAENFVNITRANCTSVNTDLDSGNIARVDRLAIHDSDIVKMVVLAWS